MGKPHLFIEIAIFLLSAGGMGYTAQKNLWGWFTACMLGSAALLGLTRWFESSPLRAYLKDLESRRNRSALNFEAWGIKDVFNMRHQDEIARRNAANQLLIQEGNRFSLLAESAASYIEPTIRRHWDALKTKLDGGCQFRLLILDPFCDSKVLRNKQNNVTAPIDPKLRIDRLRELAKAYKNVEVRFTTEPYCSIFITDKGLIYDPYHLGKDIGRIENYFLAVEIEKAGDEKAYMLMSSHFDTLWNQAQSMATWLKKHRDRLP